MGIKTQSIHTVDAYIAAAPMEVREKLEELRAVIMSTVPAVEECISYGMPYYNYKGRLVYFRLCKKHIGFYVPSPVVAEHKSELGKYAMTEATLHFPLYEELPAALIKKLVLARMKKNDEAEKGK